MNRRRLSLAFALLVLIGVTVWRVWPERTPPSPAIAATPASNPSPVSGPLPAPPAFAPARFELPPDPRRTPVEPAPGAGWSATVATDRATARQQIRAGNRINLDAMYGRLFAQAGFSPEQREKFLQNRLDARDEVDRLFKAAGRNSTGRDREGHQLTLDVIKEQVAAEYDEKLLADLGSDSFASYHRFETERVLRNAIREVGRGLASVEPLSDVQNERLVSLLALSSASPDRVDFGRIDLDRALAAAGEFLNGPQLEALRPLLAERIRRGRETAAPPPR